MKTRFIFFILIALIFVLSGCNDISNRTLTGDKDLDEPTRLFTDINDTATAEASVSSAPIDYPFTEKDEKFLSRTVFLGEGLCKALSSYGIISSERIIMKDNDTYQYENSEIELITVLANTNPSVVVVSVDDVEAVLELIPIISTYSSDAKVIVLSIFSSDEGNKENNTALRKAVNELRDYNICYLDTELKPDYFKSDEHILTELGCHAVLWQICNNAVWGNFDNI